MNKQYKSPSQRGIEWTDYTWNPIGGCQHQCRWEMPDGTIAECYAETVAHRVARSAYPQGFAHHYFKPDQLTQPLALKKPARIFLDSMSDLMGAWIPDGQVNQVLDICRQSPHHSFQLLTKNAPRLTRFDFPPNVWVGVSAPPTYMFGKRLTTTARGRMVNKSLSVLDALDVPVKWISIEPLSFDIAPHLVGHDLQWAIIGAASNGNRTYQPEAQWVQNVLNVLDAQQTPIFFKGNLQWEQSRWREEFPQPIQPTTQQQEQLL